METYTYNAGGLLTSRTWSDATPAVTYTYDAAARLLTMVNASSTVSWTYDALDRRISETQHLAGAAARTVGYAYDDDGNLAALGRPDGTEVAYAYDLRDQLTAVTADGPPPLAQYSYDEMGRRTNLLLENGQNTASTFDTAGRLLAHTHTIGGNPLDAVGYTLNANGWRTAIARPGGKDDAFTYDTTGQVLTAAAASTAGPTSESFAYDLASNRTSSTATPPDGVQGDTPMTYAANSLDQYTSLNGQAQTHDANGNTLLLRQPTQDDVTFDWDSENRMLVQERGGSDPARIVNHYDALHRRVKKDIYEKPGGTFVLVKTHTFIYDGWNVIEERQSNSSGTLTALTRLTWGTDLSGSMQGAGGIGGLLMAEEIDLADVDPPTAHYYWYDGNGNVTGITDDTGAIEGTYRYTSFGALAESTTTTAFVTAQPWKFSTKYHDPEVEPVAGTYYYGYRHYLPSVGRWPSRDPIEEVGGINLYGMCYNNPVNWFDSDGRAPMSWPVVPPPGYPASIPQRDRVQEQIETALAFDVTLVFAAGATWDEAVRIGYDSAEAKLKQGLNRLVSSGVMSADHAADIYVKRRNWLRTQFRSRSTPVGRYIAEKMRPTSEFPTYEELLRRGKTSSSILATAEANKQVTTTVRNFGRITRGCAVVSLGFTLYDISSADPAVRPRVASGHVGAIAGGVGGAYLLSKGGGVAGTTIGGPIGGGIGATGGAIIGGIGGAIVGELAAHKVYDFVIVGGETPLP